MRIYTLGTSHGNSTITRFNSSTAYEAEDGALYMVDCGAPAEALLRRKGLQLQNVRAVFITHMHDDHAGGLSGFAKQKIKYGQNQAPALEIYFPEKAAVDAFKGWFSALHEEPNHVLLKFNVIDDGPIYEDDHITVTAIRTKHCRTRGREEGDPCSFAFVIDFKKEKKRILHTGDLSRNLTDYPDIAYKEHFDVCLCEATHCAPETALPYFMQSKFDRMVFIHIGDPWHRIPADRWEVDDGERRLYDIYKNLPFPVLIAHDGDEFLV